MSPNGVTRPQRVINDILNLVAPQLQDHWQLLVHAAVEKKKWNDISVFSVWLFSSALDYKENGEKLTCYVGATIYVSCQVVGPSRRSVVRGYKSTCDRSWGRSPWPVLEVGHLGVGYRSGRAIITLHSLRMSYVRQVGCFFVISCVICILSIFVNIHGLNLRWFKTDDYLLAEKNWWHVGTI